MENQSIEEYLFNDPHNQMYIDRGLLEATKNLKETIILTELLLRHPEGLTVSKCLDVFMFMKEPTLRRKLNSLVLKGMLIKDTSNESIWDKTATYKPNYENKHIEKFDKNAYAM